MNKISTARVTMKEFVNAIEDDEEMLKFAADHLDADENDTVEITVIGGRVSFEMVKETRHDLQVRLDYRSAKCSCGGWKTIRKDKFEKPFTSEELEELWKQHL